MPEEHGNKTGASEHMELEHSDFAENSSQPEPGGEEVRDITVDHEMEPERGDMIDNFIPPGEVACDITIDQGQMEADIGDEQDSDGLIEEKTDFVKEESGDLIRTNIGTPEGPIGKTSPVPTENSSTARKKGTAVIVGPNHKFTIQSRYLSSPIGSCHDSCKFGHRHESEKKISLTSGMIRRARLMRTQSHDLSKSAPKEETKKKTFIRQLSLPSSIEEEAGEPPSVEMNRSKKDLKNSKLTRLQSEIKPSSIPTPRQTSRRKSEIQPNKKVVVRNFNLLESSSLGIKAIKTKKEKWSHSMGEKEKGKEPTTSSSSSPKTLVKKSPSMKARLYKNVKSFSRPSKLSSKEVKIDGLGNVPEKTLYMIEPDTEKKPAKRASRFSLSNENLPSTSSGPRVSKSNDSKANQKGNRTMKEQSQLGENQPEWDSVNTKQIDTITEVGASNTPIAKSPMGGGGSKPNTPRAKSTMEGGGSKPNTPRARSTMEGGRSKPNTPRGKSTVEGGGSKPNTPRAAKSTVEHGGSKPNTLRAKSTKGHGGSKPKSIMGDGGSKPSTPRTKSTLERKTKAKGKVSGFEEKDGPAWKVKFKKGTVVALQTANSAPKKLLFKRGRILGDDQIAKDEVVRILKNRDRRGNEPRDAKQPESRNVRLRHQEASSRKETVDLNNVIEETASQLVKTRKSKVKALVGAFETVMSLRDRKAMAETSAS